MGLTDDLTTHTRDVIIAKVGSRLASMNAYYPGFRIPEVERSSGLPPRPYILFDMPDADFQRIKGGLIGNVTMYVRVYIDRDSGGELLGDLLDDITEALISDTPPRNLAFGGYNIIDRTQAPSTTVDIIGGRLELEVLSVIREDR